MSKIRTISERKQETKVSNHDKCYKEVIIPIYISQEKVIFPYTLQSLSLEHKDKVAIQFFKKLKESTKQIIGIVLAKPDESSKKEETFEIYNVGTLVNVTKTFMLADGSYSVLLEGGKKFQIKKIVERKKEIIFAKVDIIEDSSLQRDSQELPAVMQSIKDVVNKYIKLEPITAIDMQQVINSDIDAYWLIYFMANHLPIHLKEQQKILEGNNMLQRAKILLQNVSELLELAELQQEVHMKIQEDIEKKQRDFYLKQHIKTLQEALGNKDSVDELEELRMRGKKKKWPKEVGDFFEKELSKLEKMSSYYNHEHVVNVNHLELMLDLPWEKYTKDRFDLKKAEELLNQAHYGLDKVKERIIEFLAVKKLQEKIKGPILCFYGPPGIGKSSLGESIAKALNRKFFKISLGGLGDEAELRGHRKTYVAAMPGKIIQALRKVKVGNPVLLLDEIDKIGHHPKGDPAAALLEILDPDQNHTFVDNFLEIGYDLSNILFLVTANSLDTIPRPLRDRLEIIEINGYTVEEKLQIVQKHLLTKQKKENGLKYNSFSITPAALTMIIEEYTRESGVRELSRKLGSICRKVAKHLVLKTDHDKRIQKDTIQKLLGASPYDKTLCNQINIPGVAIGLAWTPVGGDILFIEATLSRGRGKVTLSGTLGDVMKESAMAALSYIKSYASDFNIPYYVFEKYDLHIHLPEGAVPKDGPSAGITLFSALLSLYTQRKVKDKLAMSGEITLRGNVLPVGGIKEKILAAKRAGIKHVILHKHNEKDVKEIKPIYIQDLKITYIEKIDELIPLTLHQKALENRRVWEDYKKLK